MSQPRRRSVTVLAVLGILMAASLVTATRAMAGGPTRSTLTGWGRTPSPTSGPGHSAPLQMMPGHRSHAVGPVGAAVSRNWSGYIATGSTFKSVAGQWRVPTVSGSGNVAASATWIGIDGVTNRSLIQTGTAQDSSSTGASYFAWAEIIPHAPVDLFPVSPGDQIRASIVNDSPGTWTLTIADANQNNAASGPVGYAGPATSAEWIEEAPTSAATSQVLTLANFSTATFTDVGYGAQSRRSVTLNPVQMADGAGDVIAYPGRLVNKSFTITYRSPPGYDLVGSDGGVFVFGGGFFGSLPGLGISVDDITRIVPTARRDGYFLVGSDGGVFAFNAPFANSLPGIGVRVDDIVGIVPTLDDRGYFLVGRDGGVFSFNAPFESSLPGAGIHVDDIVGIAATSDDNGYWLVGSDGSVYAFGDAHYLGNAPAGAVAITATRDGGGYWVVGKNGAVTASGDARSFGDLPALGVAVDDIVGIVVSPDSRGYNLIGSDGGVFSFGDAANLGSLPGLGVHVDNVVGAVPT